MMTMKIFNELSQLHYENRRYSESFDGLIYFPIEKKGTIAVGVTGNIEIALTFVKDLKNLLFKTRMEVMDLLEEYNKSKEVEVYEHIKENGIKSINLKNINGLVKLNKVDNTLTISRELIHNSLHRLNYLYENNITNIPIFIKSKNHIDLYYIKSIEKSFYSFIIQLENIPRGNKNGKNN